MPTNDALDSYLNSLSNNNSAKKPVKKSTANSNPFTEAVSDVVDNSETQDHKSVKINARSYPSQRYRKNRHEQQGQTSQQRVSQSSVVQQANQEPRQTQRSAQRPVQQQQRQKPQRPAVNNSPKANPYREETDLYEEDNMDDVESLINEISASTISIEKPKTEKDTINQDTAKAQIINHISSIGQDSSNKADKVEVDEDLVAEMDRFMERARNSNKAKSKSDNVSKLAERHPDIKPSQTNRISNKPYIETVEPKTSSKPDKGIQSMYDELEEEEQLNTEKDTLSELFDQSESYFKDDWIDMYEKAQRSKKNNEVADKIRRGRFRINKEHQVEILPDMRTDNKSADDMLNSQWM